MEKARSKKWKVKGSEATDFSKECVSKNDTRSTI